MSEDSRARLSRNDILRRRELEMAAHTACLHALVGAALRVPVEELSAPTRRKAPIARARQIAMYLAHVALGLSLTRIAIGFGRDRTTAGHACRLIEDLRDTGEFDRTLAFLEFAASLSVARCLSAHRGEP